MRERSGNYRTNIQRTSPRRENISSQLDDHSNRIKELLRADLIMLEEENAILKAKCKKVNELEDKVEMVLKQNSQLLSQNQRLSKLLHQKKQEYDILRDKLEAQSNQKLSYATQFDYQRKKLLAEIDSLENELREIEILKNNQINEIKSQYQIQLQTFKRQNTTSQDVYEQQIRKLREQLDKKQYEMSDTLNRLKRFSSQAEYDVLRLKEEKEKLRNQLLYLENDKKKELDAIRAKLQTNYLEEIESIKKNHLSSLEGFELENNKLKELVDSKTAEIDQLSSKFNKQKLNYEDTITNIKKENQTLRNKLVQLDRFSESEKDTLKVKLSKMHQSQIEEMRINQQKYIDCLQNEIVKLESTVNKKNTQIQQLIKEKSAVRQMFDSEGNRLKEEIDTLQAKIKDLDSRYGEAVSQYEQKIKEKSKHIDYLDNLSQDQLQNHENEIRTLKQIIEHHKSEIQSQKLKSRQRDQQNQDTIDDLKSQNTSLRENLNKERSEKDKTIQDLTYELQGTITTLKTKADNLSSRNGILERELISLKETITFKDRQIKNLQERSRVSEQRQKKLERQNDELRSKLIKKDQKTNEMLDQQKKRLEATFAFTIDNLKIDHESALKLEANKQVDLNQRLRRKDIQLDDLLRSYKKMRQEMEGLTQQEANKKEMTLKFPGATADLIATKNLFDVFLKSRVLDVCGDARDKQNKGK